MQKEDKLRLEKPIAKLVTTGNRGYSYLAEFKDGTTVSFLVPLANLWSHGNMNTVPALLLLEWIVTPKDI